MRTGKTVKRFPAKDGREVVLRTPRWEDLDELLELINSLVDEGAEIGKNKKATREEEINWLASLIARVEKGETSFLVADVKGKIIASSDVNPRTGYESHVGGIGIVIRHGYRDVGIGTEIMRTQIDLARKMGLKVLTLTAFASNERAIHVYEKVGFVQTGRIPRKHFKDGKYIDEVIMTNLLE
jgi:RimJ/RimL family protein N-acetyltransferase